MNKLKDLFKAMNERPIAYHKIYTSITGKLTAGVLLSQLAYWGSTRDYKEFYKTNNEIALETGLSICEVKSAKKLLISKNLINVELKSLPRKSYYTVQINNIAQSISSWYETNSLVGTNSTHWKVQKPPTTSEITSENTSEITIIDYIDSFSSEKMKIKGVSLSFSVFQLFIEKYNIYFVDNHPFYKKDLLYKCLNDLKDYIEDYDITSLKDWEIIIKTYFDEFYKKTNCYFRLFTSGAIIENLHNRILRSIYEN